MKLALKIDVDTFRGTREGVPRLVEMLQRHEAGATFLFSLGPDHTGRAIKRALRPGFMQKVGRTSVVSHYGIRTLLYGTLLPGPDIGKRCAKILTKVRDDGFEVGIHTWDHVKWQDGVADADAKWTTWQMSLAAARFLEVFGETATVHGAAGWQQVAHVSAPGQWSDDADQRVQLDETGSQTHWSFFAVSGDDGKFVTMQCRGAS